MSTIEPCKTWRTSDFLVGVGVLVTRRDPTTGHPQILLTRRLSGASHGVGFHSMPGGNLEGSDGDVIRGGLRELREETGLMAEPRHARLLSHVGPGKRDDGQPYVTVYVLVDLAAPGGYEVDLADLRNPEPAKHADWQWYGVDNLPEPMWSHELIHETLCGMATRPPYAPHQAIGCVTAQSY